MALRLKLSLATRLYIGFALSFLVAATTGLVNFVMFHQQVTEAQLVNHTHEVISVTENLQKLILDMETGIRGYRMGKDVKFLEPYNAAIRQLPINLEKLEQLVDTEPSKSKEIRKLKINVKELLEFWRVEYTTPIDLSENDDAFRITDQEKDQIDRIRRQLATLIQQERTLLLEQQSRNQSGIKSVSTTVIAGNLIVQAIILGLVIGILREFKIRREGEKKLQRNFAEIEGLNKLTNQKNWLLTGIGKIDETLKGVSSHTVLTQQSLSTLIEYLKLPAGVFYLYDDHTQRLRTFATYELPIEEAHSFLVGEGAPGMAARQRDIYVMHDFTEEQQQMIRQNLIVRGTREIVLLPLFYNNELKGVIELFTPTTLSADGLHLLRSVSNPLAIAIHTADAREYLQQALEKLQAQKGELENQQEELRQTNEELTRQTEILQASEEELRVHEEELRQINAELEETNEAVEIARQALLLKTEELEVAGKYKSEFLANMSHELRTPLNSILILARLLGENKKQNLSEKQIEYANIIQKSGQDLLQLINDILDLSKIESGKLELLMEHVSVDSIVQDVGMLFQVQVDSKEIGYSAKVEEDVPSSIYTDKLRLEQVIKNLLSNAIKFTDKGGHVGLHLRSVTNEERSRLNSFEPFIAIDVTDSGIGIPADKQDIIFEAFKQADGSTNRKYGGTGLGLSISRELMSRLGGNISLSSEPGKGSTFTLYMPVKQVAEPARPVSLSRRTAAPEAHATMPEHKDIEEQKQVADDRDQIRAGDRVILIIEDDIGFASIVRDFAQSRGFKTIVALSGDEGLLYASRYKPSAVILDLSLPVLNGVNVLRSLKSSEALKNIPVHVISGTDEFRSELTEALAFLHKPVTEEDLERVFSTISLHLDERAKKLLVLSGDYLKDEELKDLISERNFQLQADYVRDLETLVEKVGTGRYDCIIVDLGKKVTEGISLLRELEQRLDNKKIPIILYLDQDISTGDEWELKKLSDTVIRESKLSKDRLMDELELFLYKLKQTSRQLQQSLGDATKETVLENKKVLLVDDDMRNVFALSMLLEEERMNVVTAGDGREALAALQSDPKIDLVLMDIMMPEMDGYEAMRHIRQNPGWSQLPVIALTAKAMSGDKEKCLEAGASDYITKPVDSNQLFSLMRVWLSK